MPTVVAKLELATATKTGRRLRCMRFGVDTGGTFTDLVGDDGRVVKVPSTPDDPMRALQTVLDEADAETPAELLAHGTTVATNALLEGRGGRVALVTTHGFADKVYDRAQVIELPLSREHVSDHMRGRP